MSQTPAAVTYYVLRITHYVMRLLMADWLPLTKIFNEEYRTAMKFTAGYWTMRAGVTPLYAREVYEVQLEPAAFTVFATTLPTANREDTTDQTLITARYSSPLPNVIRVQLYHHNGGLDRGPHFELELYPQPDVQVEDCPDATVLTSGQLAVKVGKKNGWRVEFLDGQRVITGSGLKAVGLIDTPEGRFVHEQLNLSVGENVYGLGERFTSFVKNGQTVDIWNEDGGTSSEIAYKNVPFYMTNRGYGVFVNQPEKVSFEVASENVQRVQFSVPGEGLDYFVIYGPTRKEVLERYTALTGRPALPPAWSFGLWLSTSFTTDYDEATVNSFIDGMAERQLPLSVFHFDCFWMREFRWVDLTWDERIFPDPPGMLARLKERGLKICLWINPYVSQQSPMFAEGKAGGYLIKRPDGGVWQWDRWQSGMAVVDFTNPAARAWYGYKLRALLDMGVDSFKTDFGERIPTDVVYHDGSDPERMHNYYAYLYTKTVFDILEERLGRGEAVVFARSSTAGGQRFPVHWGGDNAASYESMAESLRGGLSLTLSGFGFWSHDIGGFEAFATPDLYKRWCAFGMLSSHSRLHSNRSYRVPWLFDEEAVDVLRHFTRLKLRLMPYLFGAAVEAHEKGVPVMRAMLLEFPNDPAVDGLDRQYMLGESLLVAPVFAADGCVNYYLPAGRWTYFLSNQTVEGGRWVSDVHDYMSLPLLVRPNSVIPVGANDERPDYDYASGVTLHVFELADGASCSVPVPTPQGKIAFTATVMREGNTIYAHAENAPDGWGVLLRGQQQPRLVEGGNAQEDALGALITAKAGSSVLKISLREE